jgi:hypothetical protein
VIWITLLLAGLLAVVAVGYVIWPLVRPTRPVLIDEEGPLAELILRKDTLLLSIKELEFDYQTGKLSQEDYARFDARLRQQAIGLLRQIEQAMPDSINLEMELEAAIRRRRQVTEQAPTVTVAPTFSCPRCQTTVRENDNFCPKCGFALTPATAQSAS